jgi:hypothetical protein
MIANRQISRPELVRYNRTMHSSAELSATRRLHTAVRSLGIILLVTGIISIQFFITPAPIRIANLILAGGLILTLVAVWPERAAVMSRFGGVGSGAKMLSELGVWLMRRMETIEARTRAWHVAAVLAALFLLSLIGSRGGILDGELDQYIPHYLSNRSLLAKTFDSTLVEVDPDAPKMMWHGRIITAVRLQRPRPLSYFVDALDARAIAWSVSKGFPHLLSASFVVFLFLNYIIVWIFCRSYLQFDRFTSGLLVCLLASDPVLNCNFSYFRSAKPGSSTFLLAGLCLVAALLVRRRQLAPGLGRAALLITVPLCLLAACLFDEQGVLITAILAVTLFIEWRYPAGADNSGTARQLLIATVAVLALFAFYGLVIHPRLCMYFGDIPPLAGLAYQTGAVRNLILEVFARSWQAFVLLVDQLRFLTGYQIALPAMFMILWMGAVAASGAAVIAAPDRADKGQGTRRGILIHLSVAFVLTILMIAALASRHEFILRFDLRRWLYSEPTTMVLMIFLILSTAAVLRSRRFSRPVVQLVLLGMFIGNVWSLPEQRRALRSGYWMPRLDLSIDFIDALKKPAGKKVPAEIAADPAYQALRPYVPAK